MALAFLAVNSLFAVGYLAVGGVHGAHAGSFADAFFFSVHTFGTIGYGTMSPESTAAHLLVTLEAFMRHALDGDGDGITFAKFARPTARVMFSKVAVVSDHEGVPTLMFRAANERRNHLVEANMPVALLKFETTAEGERVRRVHDLDLKRSSSPAFVLTWTVMHPIVPGSPLYGATAASLEKGESEIVLTFTGLDETLSQTIHARHSYLADELRFGSRFCDLIGAREGRRVIDYTKFHDVLPAPLSLSKMGIEPRPDVAAAAAQ